MSGADSDSLSSEQSVDVQMSGVRSRPGENARSPALIKTVRGKVLSAVRVAVA